MWAAVLVWRSATIHPLSLEEVVVVLIRSDCGRPLLARTFFFASLWCKDGSGVGNELDNISVVQCPEP